MELEQVIEQNDSRFFWVRFCFWKYVFFIAFFEGFVYNAETFNIDASVISILKR